LLLVLVMCTPTAMMLQGSSGSGADIDPTDGGDLTPHVIIEDPTADYFRPLLPWPTNRSLYGMDWRPGGAYGLIVGSGGTLMKLTGSEITTIKTATEFSIYDVDWKADGSEAIMIGNQSTMFRWDGDLEDLDAVDLGAPRRLCGITWNATDEGAIVVGTDGYVGLFNGTTLTRIVSGLSSWLYRVAWRPGGDYALAVGDYGVVLKINETNVTAPGTMPSDWHLWRVDWAPDGSYAIMVGRRGASEALAVRYWPDGSFEQLTLPASVNSSGLRGVDFAPVGDKAIIAGQNSTVLLWDGSSLSNVSFAGNRTPRGCGWEGDSPHAIVVGNRGLIPRWDGGVWDQRSYDPQTSLFSITWRPQGDYGLVVGEGGFMAKLTTGGPTFVDSGVSVDLFDVDFSDDGSFALACGAQGRVVRYTHSGGAVDTIKTGVLGLHGVSVKPGGLEALAVGDGGHVWHWVGGLWLDKRNVTLPAQNLNDVAWRPQGDYALIVGASGVVWEFSGGRVKTFIPSYPVFATLNSVAWDKDGRRAMVVGFDFTHPSYMEDNIWIFRSGEWWPVASRTNANFFGCAFTADDQVGVAFGSKLVQDVPNNYVIKFSTSIGDGTRSTFRSQWTILQRGAMHPTGRAVYFCGDTGYAYRMDVGEFENSPPLVEIASPLTGSTLLTNVSIDLDATGTRDNDGDLLTFTWWSNVSGYLASGKVTTVRVKENGWHRITLYVDDGKGHNVSESIIVLFETPNYPPVAVIASPLPNEAFTNEDTIVFDATGSEDPNGDSITFHWVSNVSGDIGYERTVEATLMVGEHTIILWVEEDVTAEKLRTSVSVKIRVLQANRPPNVYITDPIEDDRIDPGTEVEFNGSYSNDPDGDPLSFNWASDRDGALGSGAVIRTELTEGAHFITLTVDDGHGHVVVKGINVTVALPPNSAPTVTVSSPANNSQVKGVVTITGLASDTEGPVDSVMVSVDNFYDWVEATGTESWTYQWDTRNLLDGLHYLWIEVSDGALTTRIWVQYVVQNPAPPNEAPSVEVSTSLSGVLEGRFLISGIASDPDGRVVVVQVRIDNATWVDATGTIAWSYYLDTTQYENGPHTIQVRVMDDSDNPDSKYSEVASFDVDFDNAEVEDGGTDTGLMVMLALVVIVVVVVVLIVIIRLRAPRQ
jgi:hypothetical protein